jgi:hypothetical protein
MLTPLDVTQDAVVGSLVTANRDLALTAKQVSVAIVAAPSTFRRRLTAQIGALNAAHPVGADLIFFAERHFAGRSHPAECGG